MVLQKAPRSIQAVVLRALWRAAPVLLIFLLVKLILYLEVLPTDMVSSTGGHSHGSISRWSTAGKDGASSRTNILEHGKLWSGRVSLNLTYDPQHQMVLADLARKCDNLSLSHGGNLSKDDLPFCPCVPPNLEGEQPLPDPRISMDDVHGLHRDVTSGSWRPSNCVSQQRLCVLVTYRNRSSHLAPFMDYIHDRLQKQQREYSIYIIEQSEGSPFNRGLLFNIGFLHIMKREQACDCIILHDVDMYIEDDRALYMCPKGQALHMAAYRRHLNYSLPYVGYFGGITAVGTSIFKAANGYSNMYFGWGSEDDDLLHRLFAIDVKLVRHLPAVSRVTMAGHPEQSEENKNRLKLYFSWKSRWRIDGLNSADSFLESIHVVNHRLAMWLFVNINEEAMQEVINQ